MSVTQDFECVNCGSGVSDTHVWTEPLCPACSPNSCPECGCVNIGYWVTKQAYNCDNGCGPFGWEEV